jgi:hypothetical protein
MELQTFFDIAIALLTGLCGFVLRYFQGAIKDMQSQAADLQRRLAAEYVRRDDFQASWQDMKQRLDRIDDKLDRLIERMNYEPKK